MARPRAEVGDSENAKRMQETLRRAALFWFSGLGKFHRHVLVRACQFTGETRVKTLQRRFPAYLANPPFDDQAIVITVFDGYHRRGGIVAARTQPRRPSCRDSCPPCGAVNSGRIIIGKSWEPISGPHRGPARERQALIRHLRSTNERHDRAAKRCAELLESLGMVPREA
jgi:hypothetical protein